MVARPRVTTIEVSPVFWKNLGEWRRTSEYERIRADIARVVAAAAAGEDAGDKPFRNPAWGNVRHVHVASRLIMFTARPEPGTLRLCAVDLHRNYGIRGAGTAREGVFARRMSLLATGETATRPDWPDIRWTVPGQLLHDPEIGEASNEALLRLRDSLDEEGHSLARMDDYLLVVPEREQARVAGQWIDDLIAARDLVEAEVLRRMDRRLDRAHLAPDDFAAWLPRPEEA